MTTNDNTNQEIQQSIDHIYHLLRHLNVRGVDKDDELCQAIIGISEHLLSKDGDYQSLLTFNTIYGERFILPNLLEWIEMHNRPIDRVIELGCGTGWLGRGIAEHFGANLILTDNRARGQLDITQLDVESEEGRYKLHSMVNEDDLVVLCDVLHCLKPSDMIELSLAIPTNCQMLVLEYKSTYYAYNNSFDEQIKKKGCIGIGVRDIADFMMIDDFRKIHTTNIGQHSCYLR